MQVIKRDGSYEEFDQGKIARVTQAAGLSSDQAQALADKLAQWANQSGKSQIPALEIRNQVVAELQKVNPNAANLFVWYEGTKNKNPS